MHFSDFKETERSFFNLSVISVRAMLSVVMLILEFLRSGFYLRVDQLAAACHLCHFFKHNRVMNRFMRVLAPGKRTMVLAEHCGNGFIILIFEIISDQHACILLISLVDLFFCQIAHTGNLTVDIIRMGGSIEGNPSSGLCQACSPGCMGMFDSVDDGARDVEKHLCGCIR